VQYPLNTVHDHPTKPSSHRIHHCTQVHSQTCLLAADHLPHVQFGTSACTDTTSGKTSASPITSCPPDDNSFRLHLQDRAPLCGCCRSSRKATPMCWLKALRTQMEKRTLVESQLNRFIAKCFAFAVWCCHLQCCFQQYRLLALTYPCIVSLPMLSAIGYSIFPHQI
jgi:hypothetical protein